MDYSKRGFCSNCGGAVARGSTRCPHCGVRLSGEKPITPKKSKATSSEKLIIVISFIITLALEYFFIYPLFPNILDALLVYIILTFVIFFLICAILLGIFA